MEIKFYNVEGLDRENTFYFSSISARNTYFVNKRVGTYVSDTFYPPFFSNVIRVSTGDIDFGTHINYCSFTYDGFEYFYFIDTIDYISEEVIAIHIYMDTIQTYMFYSTVESGIIARKFIPRMIGGFINRNYIRENFASNDYRFVSREYISNNNTSYHTDKTIGYFVMKVVPKDTAINQYRVPYGEYNVPSGVYTGGCYALFICPVLEGFAFPAKAIANDDPTNWVGFSSRTQASNAFECFASVASVSYLVEWYFVPGNCLTRLMWIDENNDLILNTNFILPTNVGNFGADNASLDGGYSMPSIRILNEDILMCPAVNNYSFGFIANRDKSQYWQSKYEPVMMDNNYIHFSYGNSHNVSSINLYDSNRVSVKLYYYANVFTGNSFYYVDPFDIKTDNIGIWDKYNNIAINDAPNYIDVISDAWKQWVSYNRGTMAVTLGKTAMQAILGGATGYLANLAGSEAIEGILSKKSSYDNRYNNPAEHLRVGASKKITNITREQEEKGLSMVGNTSLSSLVASAGNAFFAPSKTAFKGNFTDDVVTGCIDSYVTIYKCSNYEEVAKFYAKNGYLVNQHIDASLSLHDLISNSNSRYYFGVIRMKDCNIHVNRLCAENICDDIKNRLIDGIRFWNVEKEDVVINNYTYDNAEV